MQFGHETTDDSGWRHQEALCGALTVHLIVSDKAPESAEFLPNRVTSAKGEELWAFDKRKSGCRAILREFRAAPYIVYYQIQDGDIVEIIPVNDLPRARKLAGGQYDWPGSRKERVRLWLAIADHLGRELRLSPIDDLLRRKFEEENRLKAEALTASLRSSQNDKADRRGAREQKRRELMLRKPITVFALSGEQVTGLPVVDTEWQCLSNVSCIAVQSYKDGKAGAPSEAFFVKVDQGGKRTLENRVKVQSSDPNRPKPIAKMADIVAEVDGVSDAIPCYTMDGLDALLASGLNGGAIRALWPAATGDSFALYRFAKGTRQRLKNVQAELVVPA